MDAIYDDVTDATVYYKVNLAIDGEYQVKVHFPSTARATTAAQYDVFITDYLEAPAGSSELGTPVMSARINQSDTLEYAELADGNDFIPIGTIDVPIADENELVTVVVRLTSARDTGRRGVLLADAVKLERIQ